MPASEIDVIFASKGRLPPSAPPNTSSSPLVSPDNNKKSKNKKTKDSKAKSLKRKRDEANDAPGPTKREVPETVFDSSAAPLSAKRNEAAKAGTFAVSAVKSKKLKMAQEEDRFKDSRGTGPRE